MKDNPIPGTAQATADGGVPEGQALLILAVDHRASLERDVYGLTAPPSPAQAAQISADKLLVCRALLDAVAQLPGGIEPGVLIDEQYGASVAELASHSGGAVSLCMPIEASGHDWFEFAYGQDWQRHARFWQDPLRAVRRPAFPRLRSTWRSQSTSKCPSSWSPSLPPRWPSAARARSLPSMVAGPPCETAASCTRGVSWCATVLAGGLASAPRCCAHPGQRERGMLSARS